MPRPPFPTVGSDNREWGPKINNLHTYTLDRLDVAANEDGTLKPARVLERVNRGNRLIALGDSITIGGTAAQYVGSGYLGLGVYLTKGRVILQRNAGISGNTTAQMLARIQADVIAYAPDWCLILGGTNDTPATPLATTLANIQAMIDALVAAGIMPILATIPPRDTSYHEAISKVNAGIKHLATINGLTCVDFYRALADPADGDWISGYTSDGIHPIGAGYKVMAQVLADTLMTTVSQATVYLTGHLNDPINLIPNGVFIGDSNADGVANGWARNAGSNATHSLEAGTGDVVGNWQVIQINTAGGRNMTVTPTITTGWAVGDRLRFSGRIYASVEADPMAWYLRTTTAGGTVTDGKSYPAENWVVDIDNGVFCLDYVVPVGTTSITPTIVNGATGTGTLKMAQMTLINLTALGLA